MLTAAILLICSIGQIEGVKKGMRDDPFNTSYNIIDDVASGLGDLRERGQSLLCIWKLNFSFNSRYSK